MPERSFVFRAAGISCAPPEIWTNANAPARSIIARLPGVRALLSRAAIRSCGALHGRYPKIAPINVSSRLRVNDLSWRKEKRITAFQSRTFMR
jgi:hypothetical protein